MSGVSLPAVRHATGGDNNPDCLLGVFAPGISGGLVAGRRPGRARHWLLRTACFTRAGLRSQEPFPFSPVSFLPDDERKYTLSAAEHEEKSRAAR